MTNDDDVEDEMITARVSHGDCIEVLSAMEADSVDLVLTDPAYASLERHRAKGTTTRLKQSEGSSNQWFDIFPNDRLLPLLQQLYRVLRAERHAYIFCDEETAAIITYMSPIAGFYPWKSLVWVKTKQVAEEQEQGSRNVDIGMGYHYRNSTERIVFLEKRSKRTNPVDFFAVAMELDPVPGQTNLYGGGPTLRYPVKVDAPGRGRRLRDLSIPDVLFAPRVRNGYPTEKPVSLAELLISQSTEPGEVVLDPFCGSGWAGAGAVALDRSAVLIDVSADAVARTRARLAPWTGGERAQ